MKYILNESPIRTSNNFRINDIKLDLDIPTKTNFKKLNIANLDDKKVIVQYRYGLGTKNNVGIKLNDSVDATIFIKESLDKPLILDYKVDNTMLFIKIDLEENATANVIIKTYGNSYNILTISSFNRENSNLTINYVNMNEGKSFISFNKLSKSNSYTAYNVFDLCGNIRLYNYENHDNEPNLKDVINTIYITKDDELLDINYYYKHEGICSYSNIDVFGYMKDRSTKSFKGTIDFIKGCKKSQGRVKEEVISLSNDTVSSSLPMILCHEEDVEGSHGVSNGKIDEDKLFYLESRGFSKEEAIKIILNTKFNNYIRLIGDESIKEEIYNYINSII